MSRALRDAAGGGHKVHCVLADVGVGHGTDPVAVVELDVLSDDARKCVERVCALEDAQAVGAVLRAGSHSVAPAGRTHLLVERVVAVGRDVGA